ncbi:MAG: NAD(P)H-dependent oxidoreductase [Geminicoccaceae bacterium]|nr:NAD(P)H-dependent oxidoreductase [Geminicoccaceae bacterium]MCB9945259.1 NAD(P)H-dependent oxidoreductase [Geminicoccaceae bacterium]
MSILHIYSHPLEQSLHGAIKNRAREVLKGDVDFLDLNAEGFNPVLSSRDREIYHDETRNAELVRPYVDRLMAASTWIVQFPTWNFGPPAILKGFLDRVFLPGVAFDLSDPARTRPLMTHVERIVGIVTYGQPRHVAWWMGDPPRKLIKRHLGWHSGGRAKIDYHALYHVNALTEDRGRIFIDRVTRALEQI